MEKVRQVYASLNLNPNLDTVLSESEVVWMLPNLERILEKKFRILGLG
jgi:hypothetical protein